jgi:hypothetical protein
MKPESEILGEILDIYTLRDDGRRKNKVINKYKKIDSKSY